MAGSLAARAPDGRVRSRGDEEAVNVKGELDPATFDFCGGQAQGRSLLSARAELLSDQRSSSLTVT